MAVAARVLVWLRVVVLVAVSSCCPPQALGWVEVSYGIQAAAHSGHGAELGHAATASRDDTKLQHRLNV